MYYFESDGEDECRMIINCHWRPTSAVCAIDNDRELAAIDGGRGGISNCRQSPVAGRPALDLGRVSPYPMSIRSMPLEMKQI